MLRANRSKSVMIHETRAWKYRKRKKNIKNNKNEQCTTIWWFPRYNYIFPFFFDPPSTRQTRKCCSSLLAFLLFAVCLFSFCFISSFYIYCCRIECAMNTRLVFRWQREKEKRERANEWRRRWRWLNWKSEFGHKISYCSVLKMSPSR